MSDTPIQHAKVVTTTPQADGSTEIVTESYYENLSQAMTEVEKQMPTSRKTLLSDIIDCIEPILKGSPRITLTIEARHNEPVKITKRVVTKKQSFPRR